MAVKIKLKRMGKIREPYYRIVVADARTKRDGRAIEEIGKYHPKAEPSLIEINSERALHWLSVGAQPTDPVRKLLEVTGDWQKYKGLPGTEGTLKTAAPRDDKKAAFAAALAETLTDGATTPKGKGRAAAKAGEARAGEAKADAAKAGEAKAEKSARGSRAGAKAVAPEAAVPGAAGSEAAVPEVAVPGAAVPEAAVPGAAGSEAAVPEPVVPEVAAAEVAEPSAPAEADQPAGDTADGGSDGEG